MEIHLSKPPSSLLREGSRGFMVLKNEFSDLIWRPRMTKWRCSIPTIGAQKSSDWRAMMIGKNIMQIVSFEMKNTICHRQETLNDTFSRENVMSGSRPCERWNLRIFSTTCLFHPRRWCVDSAIQTHRSSDLRRWMTDDHIIRIGDNMTWEGELASKSNQGHRRFNSIGSNQRYDWSLHTRARIFGFKPKCDPIQLKWCFALGYFITEIEGLGTNDRVYHKANGPLKYNLSGLNGNGSTVHTQNGIFGFDSMYDLEMVDGPSGTLITSGFGMFQQRFLWNQCWCPWCQKKPGRAAPG